MNKEWTQIQITLEVVAREIGKLPLNCFYLSMMFGVLGYLLQIGEGWSSGGAIG